MEPIKSIEQMTRLNRRPSSNKDTRLNPMQPLNEISSSSFEDVLKCEMDKNREKENETNDNDEYVDNYKIICNDCQIAMITGSCMQCGLYQYGDRYDFLIKRRRRNNAISTK